MIGLGGTEGWEIAGERSNTFSVPSNGVRALSDAAVEVLIHALFPHTRLFHLACSCIPSTRILLSPTFSLVSSSLLLLSPSPLCHVVSPFFLPHDTHTHVARSDSDNHVRCEFIICRQFGVEVTENVFITCRYLMNLYAFLSVYYDRKYI